MSSGKRKPNSGVRMIDPQRLMPSPENENLYRTRTVDDLDFARLCQSILKDGVQAPILVSVDWFIVSGHQRWRAARQVRRKKVPVIFLKLRRADHTPDEWLAVLREHNTGRQKTFDELAREKLVDIDPNDAMNEILEDRIRRSKVRVPTIDIGDKQIKRFGISEEKRPMAEAILRVLQQLNDYLPVSLRAIHYRLLSPRVYRNSKTLLPYSNDRKSYGDLSDVATRMRLNGEISWDSICDETRPVSLWLRYKNAPEFIDEKALGFLVGYRRDLLQSQAQHFEIIVEKLTVQSFIDPVARKYGMPVVVMRGNSGIDARFQICQRFKESGKSSLFLLCLGDCDPDGDSIVDSTLASLRSDFGITNVRGTRVAMTHTQADRLHLPKDLQAKESSANRAKFIAKHGRDDCYELDAVEPEVLQGWTDESIRGVLDIEAFNHEVETQNQEAQGIAARRRAVLEYMKRQ